MPHKSDKEVASQGGVQSVIERYEERHSSPRTEGQSQSSHSRYEPMTELSSRTMHALLGELTQNVVEPVNLRNIHNMKRFTQNGNAHYDNMAKQLNTLNEIMNKLVGQICQPVVPLTNHFQVRTIVGHNPPVISPSQGIEPHFRPSTSN
ncbi:Hypothetical predicted protein [Olea europaea subsp. europaea]|uniref:Uncharacterized protein n=1 Tax=Olea europaea subsp. europaea TaxID=158383 RepID=A0A8S0TMZ4_OLEEU|nr:Hypothetical predicted protein [Olea europaea subsp. europaea]